MGWLKLCVGLIQPNIVIWKPFLCLFSHVQLFATLWICSSPGSSVHGILQARILEWAAMPISRGSS